MILLLITQGRNTSSVSADIGHILTFLKSLTGSVFTFVFICLSAGYIHNDMGHEKEMLI